MFLQQNYKAKLNIEDDGDPLDAMVLTWEPTFPGCVIDVYRVALFDMEDDKGRDQKILCVPNIETC